MFLLWFVWPAPALAQEPAGGEFVGVVSGEDGVTRTMTVTLVFSPLTIINLKTRNAYTATLDTGNQFDLQRSATYGEILIGASSILLCLALVFDLIRGVIADDRNE